MILWFVVELYQLDMKTAFVDSNLLFSSYKEQGLRMLMNRLRDNKQLEIENLLIFIA